MILKEYIIQAGRVLYEKNLVAGFDGNISIRMQNKILITASETYKGFLKEEDIVLIDFDGNLLEGSRKASTEYRLHVSVYQSREDVHAVVHAHPPKSVAATVAGIPIIPCLTPEAYLMLGNIPVAGYHAPGKQELADSILPYVTQTDAILLEKHGIVTYGRDLLYALDRLEKTEALVEKIFLLLSTGVPLKKCVFNRAQRQELEKIKKQMGLKNISCQCGNDFCEKLNSFKGLSR